MTAIVQPSTGGEEATFENWNDRITTPPAGRTADQEAAAAADWILDTYLDDPRFPQRQVYRTKVTPWALTDMVLFGKLGTAVGHHARAGTATECVGYWKEGGGSTMAWEMDTPAGTGRFLFAGKIDSAITVTDVVLYDVTGVTIPNDPDTAVLETNKRWVSIGASPGYTDVTTILQGIQDGSYKWPTH
jgi:hypothetical protein